jgi:hypothetical protein
MTVNDRRIFPDPRKGEYIYAPIGPGCYELRLAETGQLVLFGCSRNVSVRLASLLPSPFGQGTRRNIEKRQFVFEHLGAIEHRTVAFAHHQEAISFEAGLAANRAAYVFKT